MEPVVIQLIFRFLRERSDIPLFQFALDFDIRDILPFELPRISQSGSVAAFFDKIYGILHLPAKKPGFKRGATELEDEDADMKTYSKAPARASKIESAPAPRKAAARSSSASGRHEVPAGSTGRKSRPGTYRGKHEL